MSPTSDCLYAIEAGDAAFAPRMKRLILRAFVIARRRNDLAEATRRSYKARLERDMDANLVDADHAIDQPGAVVAPHHGRVFAIARSGDVADQRLQDVVQCHQTLEIAILVDDQRHGLARRLEDLERAQRRHRVGEIERRPDHAAEIERAKAQRRSEQILDLENADHLARPALDHGEARIGARSDLAPVLFLAVGQIEPFDLASWEKYLVLLACRDARAMSSYNPRSAVSLRRIAEEQLESAKIKG